MRTPAAGPRLSSGRDSSLRSAIQSREHLEAVLGSAPDMSSDIAVCPTHVPEAFSSRGVPGPRAGPQADPDFPASCNLPDPLLEARPVRREPGEDIGRLAAVLLNPVQLGLWRQRSASTRSSAAREVPTTPFASSGRASPGSSRCRRFATRKQRSSADSLRLAAGPQPRMSTTVGITSIERTWRLATRPAGTPARRRSAAHARSNRRGRSRECIRVIPEALPWSPSGHECAFLETAVLQGLQQSSDLFVVYATSPPYKSFA